MRSSMNLTSQYQEIRSYTEKLCEPLQPEDYAIQVTVFASPVKWQLAHTSWFFETFILKEHLPNYQLFSSNFAFLFNSYYNNEGERVARANRGSLSRPTTDEVYAFRKYIDESMLKLLSTDLSPEIKNLVLLGLNHEQQHQELILTDLKYMFSQNPLLPAYHPNTELLNEEINTETGSICISEGVYEIGYQGQDFCFDNELGVHKVYLHDFEIEKALVTNGEYIQFIESGGYSDFNLWLDEGWQWVQENKAQAPLYWQKKNGIWHQFMLKGLQEVNPNHILKHINFYEAMAFAEWKGMRLPTEFEWEVAADKLNWGQRWEWTNSAYLPYPKFKKSEGAIGEYNGKFMVNQMVLRGASLATSKNHSRKTYRNFFHTQEQWQFTGIRLAK